jgi:hypothetical protein
MPAELCQRLDVPAAIINRFCPLESIRKHLLDRRHVPYGQKTGGEQKPQEDCADKVPACLPPLWC